MMLSKQRFTFGHQLGIPSKLLESFNKNFTTSLTHVYMLHIYKTNIICSTANVNKSPFEPMNGVLSHFLW